MRFRLRRCKSKVPCAVSASGDGRALCPEDIPRRQLRMGIKVEREHYRRKGRPSKAKACAIVLDHLAEHRDYYTRHKKAGL